MKLEGQDRNIAVIDVTIVIAVGEPRCDFSQVALSDWLTAQCTKRLRPGCPAIHHDEFHVLARIRQGGRAFGKIAQADERA